MLLVGISGEGGRWEKFLGARKKGGGSETENQNSHALNKTPLIDPKKSRRGVFLVNNPDCQKPSS